jgi:outer membrane protein
MSKDFSTEPWSVSGRIGVSLGLNGSLPYRFRNLQYLLNMELISYEQARQIYIRDIKDFFYQIILVKERIILAKDNLRLTEKQYEKTVLLYESGLASDLNLMAIKVNLANTRPEILALENDYTSKLFQLKYLTGLTPDDELELTGSIFLPEVPVSVEDFSNLIPDTLELQKFKHENLILENNRKITLIQNRIPSLSLGYSYSPRLSQPFTDSFLSEDTWLEQGSFTISMSLPLDSVLPGSSARVDLESIDAQILKNELELDQLLYTSYMELTNLINRLAGIQETLDARKLAADFSREAYEYTVASYNNGGVDLLELQNSETDLRKSRVAVLTETYNYISTIFDLEYLLGIEIIKE